MQSRDRNEFIVVIEAMAATFSREPTEALLHGYWLGLEDLDLGGVKKAAATAMRSRKFMPTVIELRELAGEIAPAMRAVLAWDAFKQGIRKCGYYTSVDFDDPIINATVRNLGDWMPVLERLEAEGDKWIRKDFERVYISLMTTGIGSQQAAPLLGYHERENHMNRYYAAIKPPVQITTGLPPHAASVSLPKPIPANIAGLLEGVLKSAAG